MKRVSFIIPVYNCERYLDTCLQSILRSGFSPEETEIVFVNDASTDHSWDTLNEIARQYAQVKIVNQEKGGPATARNNGMKVSVGEYIWFVDADDRVVEGIANSLLPYMDRRAEVVAFNYRKVFADHNEDVVNYTLENTVTGIGYLEKAYHGLYLWDKVFRRASISECFIDNTYHIEDFYFDYVNIISLKSVICLPVIGYEYVQANTDSISKRRDQESVRKANEDAFVVYSKLAKKRTTVSDERERTLLNLVLRHGLTGHLFTMMNEASAKQISQYIEKYRQVGLYPVQKTDEWRKNLFLLVANRKYLLLSLVVIKRILNKI